LELLDALPPDHSTREPLSEHIGELVEDLIRRENGEFQQVRGDRWLTLGVVLSFFFLCGVTLEVLEATGVYTQPPPETRAEHWQSLPMLALVTLVICGMTVGRVMWRRSQKRKARQRLTSSPS
jgi:hypothetical protein